MKKLDFIFCQTEKVRLSRQKLTNNLSMWGKKSNCFSPHLKIEDIIITSSCYENILKKAVAFLKIFSPLAVRIKFYSTYYEVWLVICRVDDWKIVGVKRLKNSKLKKK